MQYISASFERLILYLNPTIVLGLSVLLFKARVSRRQLAALAVSYSGVLLVFGHEASVAGTNAVLGAALVFGSAVSYAVYLCYSGEEVKRLGALRLTGLATSVACGLCILQFVLLRPMSAMVVAPEVLWLSVLNASVVHLCAGADGDDGHRAHRRSDDRPDRDDRAGVDHPAGCVVAGRAAHPLGDGRHRAGAGGHLAADPGPLRVARRYIEVIESRRP